MKLENTITMQEIEIIWTNRFGELWILLKELDNAIRKLRMMYAQCFGFVKGQ